MLFLTFLDFLFRILTNVDSFYRLPDLNISFNNEFVKQKEGFFRGFLRKARKSPLASGRSFSTLVKDLDQCFEIMESQRFNQIRN
ncbi:MAG: hypothetical protein AMJ73_07950 [candidate division Zixibacteria bacterium SM1_73]|nr:MAG: hypothetical protein AMJ73_07950 [candidate division Zixibacteria bacterium SM1_73]